MSTNIRIRVSLRLTDMPLPQDATPAQVKAEIAKHIERGITQALPNGYAVETVTVTRANIAQPDAKGNVADE